MTKAKEIVEGFEFVHGEKKEHLRVKSLCQRDPGGPRYALCERVGRKDRTKYVQVTKINAS